VKARVDGGVTRAWSDPTRSLHTFALYENVICTVWEAVLI
jgi:hypothetical protein